MGVGFVVAFVQWKVVQFQHERTVYTGLNSYQYHVVPYSEHRHSSILLYSKVTYVVDL